MKAQNLDILEKNGINVPKFQIIKKIDDEVNLNNSCRYAVRSSADIEDSKIESHAGEFKTFLNVEHSEIKNRAKEIIEDYTNKNVTGSVIIQEMVNSEYSGVIFTCNPLGILNEIHIVIGKGLGENIVDNREITTRYIYNKDDKKFIIFGEQIVSIENSVLNDLVTNAENIENIFKYPVDIEFAIENNIIYILQTRPITNVNFEDDIAVLDNSNIVESYPGISLPLTQDFVTDAYSRIFKGAVYRLTQSEEVIYELNDTFKNMVCTIDWCFYYNINNWYTILQLMPFSNKIIKVWQKMLGVQNKRITGKELKVSLRTKFRILKNFIILLVKTPKLMSELNTLFSRRYEAFEYSLEKMSTVESLFGLYELAKQSFLKDWDITLVNDIYAFIFVGLCGKKKEQDIANIKNLASGNQLRSLKELEKAYISGEYEEKFKEYINKYGVRCLGELKLETITFKDDPNLLMEYLKNCEYTESISNRDENTVTNKKDDLFLKKAKLGISNREESRLNRAKLYSLARRIFLKIGDIMVSSCKIDNKTDIFYLYENEIKQYENLDIKNIIERRKNEYIEGEAVFSRYEFIGKPQKILKYNSNKSIVHNKNSKVISGELVSRGIQDEITGQIIVMKKPDLSIDVHNKIIVTMTTDPGWAMIIRNSVGVIAEQGSLLSHTAIISRELNKLAIVNIKHATDIFEDGEVVHINCNTGDIKRGSEI